MLVSIFNNRLCESLPQSQLAQDCDGEKEEADCSGGLGMKIEEAEFHSDKLTLRGELYLPDREHCPGILVCHAMHAEGFRWLPLYRTFAQKAAEKGFACLLFDFRGCGKSEGEFDYGRSEQRDARAALEFLLNQQMVDPASAFLVGRSLGGTIAIYSLVDDPRVKGYALWATPPDHYLNIRRFIEQRRGKIAYGAFLVLSYIDRVLNVTRVMRLEMFGLNLRPRDVRSKLMTLNGPQVIAGRNHPPILLLIGDEDDYVSLSEARHYEESISGRKRLIILPGTGHTFRGAEEKVASTTLDWFDELHTSHRFVRENQPSSP
jgi:alpha/beta superfamily hydrolase